MTFPLESVAGAGRPPLEIWLEISWAMSLSESDLLVFDGVIVTDFENVPWPIVWLLELYSVSQSM